MTDIKSNYQNVLRDVEKIARDCGRNPRDVRLIAVSKTKPIEYVKEAAEAGAMDFGENRPQELVSKQAELPNLRWHQIGTLQRNKVRHIVGKCALIHSVDSLPLAQEIEKRAGALGIVQDVLIQVNITGEETKSGIVPGELGGLLEDLAKLKSINPIGLMTISALGNTQDENRAVFSKLRVLGEKFGLRELSMGMSHDYKEAIECGATMVRVGTAIFGARDYGTK